MKQKIQTAILVGVMMVSSVEVNAQASVLAHTGASTDWLGWASGQNFDLPIVRKMNPSVPKVTVRQEKRPLGQANRPVG